jgi:hypothetical protein
MKGAGELDRPIFFKTIILKGRDGTSIGSLEKTASVGVTDTYTITLTDGETYTFEVTNGTSISNISYTSSSGNVDTYTITLTDGSTQTFQVTNGEDFTVPTDGVIYYDGTDVPDGYEETSAPSGSGAYATIDDNNVSVATTYSSSKIEQLISGIGGGGVDYSTTEQDTGLEWVDGSHIYQKTVNFGSLPNNGYKDVSTGVVNFDKLINIWGTLTWPSGLQGSLDHNNFGGAEVAFQVTSSGVVRCTTQMDRSDITAVVTLQYTKVV